jgi:hypothetical protein
MDGVRRDLAQRDEDELPLLKLGMRHNDNIVGVHQAVIE